MPHFRVLFCRVYEVDVTVDSEEEARDAALELYSQDDSVITGPLSFDGIQEIYLNDNGEVIEP